MVSTQTPGFVFECPAEEISSYIDGELSAEHEAALERHIAECETCRAELNHQKSFLLALSESLVREKEVTVPPDFTRRIVVQAESDVSGVRDRRERILALAVVAVMVLLLAVALAGDPAEAFAPLYSIAQKAGAVVGVAVIVVFDLAYGAFAIARSLFSAQTFGSYAAYTVLSLGAIVSVTFLARRLRRNLRAQGIE